MARREDLQQEIVLQNPYKLGMAIDEKKISIIRIPQIKLKPLVISTRALKHRLSLQLS